MFSFPAYSLSLVTIKNTRAIPKVLTYQVCAGSIQAFIIFCKVAVPGKWRHGPLRHIALEIHPLIQSCLTLRKIVSHVIFCNRHQLPRGSLVDLGHRLKSYTFWTQLLALVYSRSSREPNVACVWTTHHSYHTCIGADLNHLWWRNNRIIVVKMSFFTCQCSGVSLHTAYIWRRKCSK